MTNVWKLNGIEAELERWRWEAHYKDGSILKQFDDYGVFHQFKEIEQDKLKVFGMVHDTLPPVILNWREGLKLIHFYKNFVFKAGTEDETRLRLYCFGYEGKNEKVILAILPDDGIVVVNDIDKFVSEMI